MERRGPAIEPKEIKHEDDFNVSITWGDDRLSLRAVCQRMDR
jgi:hypothetical protein